VNFNYDLPVSSSSKVVAITGASSGIGRAAAVALAAEGATIVASARRTDLLDSLVAEIAAAGGRAMAVPGDVTSEADMHTLVARAVEAFGRLDVMICNAGIGFYGPIDETPPDVLRRVVDVNVMGTMYAARAALEVFRRQDHGHIIAISSIAGRRGIGGSSLYSATKAAQIGFIEGLRAEFVGTNLRASLVYPVSTQTEFRDAIHRDYGHVVQGVGPLQPVESVARAIVRCVRRPRAEVYPHRLSKWLAVMAVTCPAWTDGFVKKFTRRTTKTAE
jgi:NADP-dependent 3-hydroxy acid dehydrogenase YdfG